MNATDAVARYIEIASRLPTARFPERSIAAANLEAMADQVDAFVLDGFGVLNVGAEPVPGAQQSLDNLRARGKALRVLTNGATFPSSRTTEKYLNWQMNFQASEVVSSRDALAVRLSNEPVERLWGFVALAESQLDQLNVNHVLLEDDPELYDRVDGFVLLGAGAWTWQRQELLRSALSKNTRPVLVGNPDLVAPHAQAFSEEPGLFAHDLADAGLASPEFFGKPFSNAFALAAETLIEYAPDRIAMVGDTLQTDILGGAAFGWRTVLVTDHGLLRGMDVEAQIEESGIRPDFIVPTT